jgi:hypothetical protein
LVLLQGLAQAMQVVQSALPQVLARQEVLCR